MRAGKRTGKALAGTDRTGDTDGLNVADGALISQHDVALLDLDGVVYLGAHPVAGAAETVAAVRAAGARVAFVTNNASRRPATVAEHLRSLGLPAEPEDIVTSAQAAAAVVARRFADRAEPARVLPVGGDGLREALEAVGCVLVASADDRPDVVAQGFAADLTYGDLAEAALAVRAGAWWIATNRDRTVPTERGIQPGNGALVGAVEVAVGHPPAAFAGKPDEALLQEAVRRTGARSPIFVGDRLDTDIEGAARAGMPSLFVLTGVSSGADVVAAPPSCRPSYVGLSVATLLDRQPVAEQVDGAAWVCGAWRVEVAGEVLQVGPCGGSSDGGAKGPDAADLLRAVCAAAWSVFDGAPPGGLRVSASAEGSSTPTARDAALTAIRAARLHALLPADERVVG